MRTRPIVFVIIIIVHTKAKDILIMKSNSEKIRLLALTGLFAALITVATTFVRIPVAHNGYYHAGDSIIYIAASLLPAPYAMLASSIGGVMADVVAGAPEWILATAIIKPINTIPFIIVRHFLKKRSKDDKILHPAYIAMLLPTSLITIIGYYYIAAGIMFGFDIAFLSIFITGWMQPVASGIVYLLLGAALDGIKFKSKIYPDLMIGKVRRTA